MGTRELWEGLARAGVVLTRAQAARLVAVGDADGDGALSLKEFLTAFEHEAVARPTLSPPYIHG